MRLGGWTALAARWAHRHSTDLDPFTDQESYVHLWEYRDAFVRAIIQRAGPTEVLTVLRWNTKIVLHGGREVTLFTSLPQTDNPRSEDTVRGTRVPLAANAEILAKKLWGQMLDSRRLPARDLYDFAVARHHDPAAVKAAMKNIDVSELRQLKHELTSLGEGWTQRANQRALIRPAYTAEAKDPAPFVADQVLREILSRTPDRHRRHDISWELLTAPDLKCSIFRRFATSFPTRRPAQGNTSPPARSFTPAPSCAMLRTAS